MKIQKETGVIAVLLGILVGPMWFFAIESQESESPVILSQSKGVINPAETFLPTPIEVNEFLAGVITFVGLFVLIGMLYYTHRFIQTIGHSTRSGASNSALAPDGGRTDGGTFSVPPYLLAGGRRLADYWPAEYATPGLIGMVVMTWSSVSFSLLFGVEAFTWARTQYLGVYAGMAFLSLGVLVAVYTAWFMPTIHVVEDRGHEGKLTKKSD